MNFGICPLSVVPVRSSASDKSEMISQLLFGEMVELLERKGSWGKIRCFWDNYVGWVDTKQLKLINQQDVASYQNNYSCSLELFQGAMTEGHYLPITIGATLPKFDGLKFHLNGSSYTFSGQAISPKEINPSVDLLLKIARRYLYAPYLWGGRSPLGIDCSGFTQIVYKMIGIALPRDAYQQVENGKLIDFVEQALPGDLAFFENRKGRITHTGIIMPEDQIIHASGQVRIDRIDHYGIFSKEKEKYTHKLRVIKRILPETAQSAPNPEPEKVVIENQTNLF